MSLQAMHGTKLQQLRESVSNLHVALHSDKLEAAAQSLHDLASLPGWPTAIHSTFEAMASVCSRLSDLLDQLTARTVNLSGAQKLECQHEHVCKTLTIFLEAWRFHSKSSAIPTISVSMIKTLAAMQYAGAASQALQTGSGLQSPLETAQKLVRLHLLVGLLQVVTSSEGLLETHLLQADDAIDCATTVHQEHSTTAGMPGIQNC